MTMRMRMTKRECVPAWTAGTIDVPIGFHFRLSLHSWALSSSEDWMAGHQKEPLLSDVDLFGYPWANLSSSSSSSLWHFSNFLPDATDQFPPPCGISPPPVLSWRLKKPGKRGSPFRRWNFAWLFCAIRKQIIILSTYIRKKALRLKHALLHPRSKVSIWPKTVMLLYPVYFWRSWQREWHLFRHETFFIQLFHPVPFHVSQSYPLIQTI